MKGLLKTKSAGVQLAVVISIALVSFTMLGGIIGPIIISAINGMSLGEIASPAKWDLSQAKYANLLRALQVIQFFTLFVIPVWFGAKLFSENSREYLRIRKPWHPLYYLAGAGMLLLSLPFVEWLGQINQQIPFPESWTSWMQDKEDGASNMIKGLLSRHTISDLLLNIVFIAGLAAVGEELLFRGMLQRLFIKLFRSHWAGIIVSAFLFSAIHMQFFGFLPRFALGIVLGMVYWYSGSLWVAIAAHFAYDAILITVAYFSPQNLDIEKGGNIPDIALYAAASFLVISLIGTWMVKVSKTTYTDIYADDSVPVKDNPF